jgi:hypothetical protein
MNLFMVHIMNHDNDNTRLNGGATPLGTRLARAGRKSDLQRYIRHGTVTVVPTWLSAEGNLPEVGGKPQADRITEIRPSPDEIVTLAARDAIRTRDTIGPITASELAAASVKRIRHDARGVITEWRGSDGKWRPTAELFRQPKGGRRKTDQQHQDDNARHLAIRGSGDFPERSAYVERGSDGTDYWRFRHAFMMQAMNAGNDNRRSEVDRIGVGGRHTFEEAWTNAGLSPACRIPRYMTVIAKGAEFLAYRVHSNPTAAKGSFVGAPDAVETQIIETIDAPRVDAALGNHAKVLDLSIAGLTAREIAAKLGWGDTKQAERRAVAAQDAALQALAGLEEKLAA